MSIKVENLINLDRLTQYDGLIKNKIKEHSDIQASDTVSGHVKVDTGLSDTSTNPVQNKAVKNALDSKVPITRTVNGKALSSNISLSASDVGADPSGSSTSALSSAKSYTDAQISTVNSTLTSHTGNISNPHSVTKAQVGLEYANNTADKDKYVKGILDYADTSRSIQIGYSGAGLTIDEATHIAAYTEDGHKIKDLSFEKLKTKLGLNGAEPNQNAFSNIVVGSTTIEADSKTDTLTLVGSNVTITPDATNDKITIGVASGSTSTKGIVQLTDSTSSTSTTTAATPKSVKSAYDLANTAKTAAANAQSTADSKVGSVSMSSGTNNGTLKLTVDGTATDNIAVKGLGSAAYTNTSAYATAAQGTKADNAMPKAGGTFTGAVTLNADPSTALGAATKQYVDAQITSKIAASDAMVFKGTLGSNGTITAVPTTGVVKGDTYKVITAGTWAGSSCKVGDLLIALTSGSVEATTTNWAYVPSGDEVTTFIKYSTTTQNLTTSAKTGEIILAEGAIKQVDTSISAGSSSTKLPTSAAVASFVEGKGYTTKAFKNVTVGSVTVEADSNADTLTLEAGDNVTIVADATNDKITISATDTKYSAAGTDLGLVKSGGNVTISNGVITVDDNSHNHVISNIEGLQTALDGKAPTSHGIHVIYATTTPLVAGTGAVGTSDKVAREDHVHPLQTTVSGNAGSATKLENARNFSITGGATASNVSFNGTGNVALNVTSLNAMTLNVASGDTLILDGTI